MKYTKYICLMGGGAMLLYAAYVAGMHNGNNDCRVHVAADNIRLQTQIIKQQGEINAETLRSRVDDIRDVLRAKYTIAE